MLEVWRDVPSYPEIEASSLGRVRKKPTTAVMPNGGIRVYVGKPKKGYVSRSSRSARHEYLSVHFRDTGTIKVHQAVCEAFHGLKPFSEAVVIHIDEDALNNEFTNLRWGTQKENLNAPGFIAYCKSRTGDSNPLVKSRKQAQKG